MDVWREKAKQTWPHPTGPTQDRTQGSTHGTRVTAGASSSSGESMHSPHRRKYIDACVVEAALAALHLDALASGVATVCSASGGSATRNVSRARTRDGTRTSFAQVYSVPGPQIFRNTSKNRTPSSPMVCCCLLLCTLLLPVQPRASSATEHFLALPSRTKIWTSKAAWRR